ncbi:endopolyphosphatase [Kwoniella mangroviensis CBS 10435]|uniref:Endopolyphosphatase n=1 Tax=Kwoniella mangroviensis CBS 10435 TaxID=1331196 RepID=A0A1B9J1X2_9TREE|nr:endopolyphosphatase [Kwoniella mangroviensis CBS 10435]
MRSTLLAGLFGLAVTASSLAASSSEQVVLGPSPQTSNDGIGQFVKPKRRPLKGRFLHITDIHPDPHYKSGATFDSGCHKRDKDKKGKKGKGKGKATDVDDDYDDMEMLKDKNKDDLDLAGKWGTAVSKCDTPMSLVNITFDWLKEEWKDEIDFIIWTGDNARHDIDRSLPRTPNEIYELNRMVVSKMLDTFGTDIPIVPSIGNNDIYPHNVMAAGPSKLTEEFLHIWSKFIPPDYSHVFERGAYYSVEVIPDTLAVISLNTLFWYDSNTLVDGCGDHSNDPGALEMDWLDVQLSGFRDRGMQVWLTGHVPPHMGYYYDNCYLRYGDLALRYQDTIVGHLFGHMNIDHFFFIDVDELEATPVTRSKVGSKKHFSPLTANLSSLPSFDPLSDNSIGIFGAGDVLKVELRKDFQDMPGPKDLKLKDYIAVNVAASVIPTYLPGLRIFSYNISGLGDEKNERAFYKPHHSPTDPIDDDEDEKEEADELKDEGDDVEIEKKKPRRPGHRHGKRPKGDCKRPENEDKPHCVFRRLPRYYSKESPSRSNKALTPLGYTQFYLPKLNKQKQKPEWEIEYTTYKKEVLVPPYSNGTGWDQPPPIPLGLLPEYDQTFFDNNENASDEEMTKKKKTKFEKALKKITPWKMPDLTIPNYVKLSRKLVGDKDMWDKFQELM